jgi:hypothetical protein
MFSCYGNVDELMLNTLDTSMACVYFLRKLPPTSKGDVEDGRHIGTNIGKGQHKEVPIHIQG